LFAGLRRLRDAARRCFVLLCNGFQTTALDADETTGENWQATLRDGRSVGPGLGDPHVVAELA
jgi:hypothetical protein